MEYICFSEFFCFVPNWFEVLSLIFTVLAIVGAYLVANHVYNRGKKDQKKETNLLMENEVLLFRKYLDLLDQKIESEIGNLNTYLESQNYYLKWNMDLHVDFLNYLNVNHLYKYYGLHCEKTVDVINKLLSVLPALNGFGRSVLEESRTYMERYQYFESKYYTYKSLLHENYYTLVHALKFQRNQHQDTRNQAIAEDSFLSEYCQVRSGFYRKILPDLEIKDRSDVIDHFISPLLNATRKFIPENPYAIETFKSAEEVNIAFVDMEKLTHQYRETIKNYIEVLQSTKKKIEDFQKLSKSAT